MVLDLRTRTFYRDHLLSHQPTRDDAGRFQARVAITYLGGEKTRAQRFLDLEAFDSEQEAIDRGRAAGIAWVDRHA